MVGSGERLGGEDGRPPRALKCMRLRAGVGRQAFTRATTAGGYSVVRVGGNEPPLQLTTRSMVSREQGRDLAEWAVQDLNL